MCGGLNQFLALFRDRFRMDGDPPLNHISLASAVTVATVAAPAIVARPESPVSLKADSERALVAAAVDILITCPSRSLKVRACDGFVCLCFLVSRFHHFIFI